MLNKKMVEIIFLHFFFELIVIFFLFTIPSKAQQWHNLGLNGETVNVIVVDHQNPLVIYAGTSSKIFKSLNGGISWDTLLIGVPTVMDMAMHPDSSQILYVSTLYAIIKSTDSGQSWFRADNGVTLDFDTHANRIAIDAQNPQTLYLGTGGSFPGKLYKTTDGGISWTVIYPNPALSVVSVAVSRHNPLLVFFGEDWRGTIFRSTDGGINWDSLTSFNGIDRTIAIDPNNDSVIYCSSFDSGIYKSVDMGTTWVRVDSGITGVNYGRVIVHPDTSSLLYGITGTVFYSSNAGEFWQPINNGLLSSVKPTTIEMSPDRKTLYLGANAAGTPPGGIYRYDLVTSVNENLENRIDFFLRQNYPNPFNPVTIISYQLPPPDGRAGIGNHVTLKVYDVLGREIATLVNATQTAGHKSVRFDANNLPSGVYFYRLNAGTFMESKKMIIMK